jgi:hypothetical protein
MSDYPYEKKPAFFRILPAEMFFEADLASSELKCQLSSLNNNPELEAELDALLRENNLFNPEIISSASTSTAAGRV